MVVLEQRALGLHSYGDAVASVEGGMGSLVPALDAEARGKQAEDGRAAGAGRAHPALADRDLAQRGERGVEGEEEDLTHGSGRGEGDQFGESARVGGNVHDLERDAILAIGEREGGARLLQKLDRSLEMIVSGQGLQECGGEGARRRVAGFGEGVAGARPAGKARLFAAGRDRGRGLDQRRDAGLGKVLVAAKVARQQVAINADVEQKTPAPKPASPTNPAPASSAGRFKSSTAV